MDEDRGCEGYLRPRSSVSIPVILSGFKEACQFPIGNLDTELIPLG